MLVDLHVPCTQHFLQVSGDFVQVDGIDSFGIAEVPVEHSATHFRYREAILLKTKLPLTASDIVDGYVVVLFELDVCLGNLFFASVAKCVGFLCMI